MSGLHSSKTKPGDKPGDGMLPNSLPFKGRTDVIPNDGIEGSGLADWIRLNETYPNRNKPLSRPWATFLGIWRRLAKRWTPLNAGLPLTVIVRGALLSFSDKRLAGSLPP